MARLSLNGSIKFKRLVRRIGLANPFVRGLLETLWDSCHSKGNPLIGDAMDVEIASEWPGESGAWFEVLRDGGWIDRVDEDRWQLHDYWEHAPEFVIKRAADAAGMTYSQFREAVKQNIAKIKSSEILGKVRKSSEKFRSASEILGNPRKSSEKFPLPDQTRPDQTSLIPPTPYGGGDQDQFEPDPGFAAFWAAYPKQVARKAARRAWEELAPDDALAAVMLAAVTEQSQSVGWKQENGRFIPNAAKWIREEWWNRPDVKALIAAKQDRDRQLTAQRALAQADKDKVVIEGIRLHKGTA